jgi:hypothetical protein
MVAKRSSTVSLPRRSPIWPPMVRLRALIGRERRIEMPSLHLANQTEDRPIAEVPLPLQGGSEVEQECGARVWLERRTGAEDGIELSVGERDRRHRRIPRREIPRLTLERPSSQCDAAVMPRGGTRPLPRLPHGASEAEGSAQEPPPRTKRSAPRTTPLGVATDGRVATTGWVTAGTEPTMTLAPSG